MVILVDAPSNDRLEQRRLALDHLPRLAAALAASLAALGIHDMILLSNTSHSPVALAGYGLAIVEERPIRLQA